MKKLRITQIQFQAKPTPKENALLLKKYFEKSISLELNLSNSKFFH